MINLIIPIDRIEIEKILSLKCIVNNHSDSIILSDTLDNRSVALEYIEFPEVLTSKNLKIVDRSWESSNLNNRRIIDNSDYTFFVDSRSFEIPYKDILITNVSKNGTPIFFKHKIKNNKKIINCTIHSITNTSDRIVESGYLFDEITGQIYTNYQNTFDLINNFYKVFFVTYVTEDNLSYNEILNPEPIIKELSYEDIDLDSVDNYGNVKKNLIRFKKEKNSAQLNFKYEVLWELSNLEILCNDSDIYNNTGFWIKPYEASTFRILNPVGMKSNSPWFVRLTNTEMFTDRFYMLPEYYKQAFNPEFGITYYLDKDTYFVNQNILGVLNNIKFNQDNELHFNLYEYNQDGSLLNKYTTNSNLDSTWIKDRVFSCDERSGYIYTDFTLNTLHIYKIDYYSELKDYTYNAIDFNPVNNSEVLEYSYLFFLKSRNNLIYDMSQFNNLKALYHLKLDSDYRIVGTDCPEISYKLEPVYFKDNFYLQFKNDYLILAEVSLNNKITKDQIFNFDLRKYDYMNDSELDSAFQRNHNILQSYLGYGSNGQILQKYNVDIIKYPFRLLKEYGGDYTLETLKRNIQNNIELYRDFVLIPDYLKPEIFVNYDSPNHSISCTWEGPGIYKLKKWNNLGQFQIVEEINQIQRPVNDRVLFTNLNIANKIREEYTVAINDELDSNRIVVGK